jgi:hypothetical protein
MRTLRTAFWTVVIFLLAPLWLLFLVGWLVRKVGTVLAAGAALVVFPAVRRWTFSTLRPGVHVPGAAFIRKARQRRRHVNYRRPGVAL